MAGERQGGRTERRNWLWISFCLEKIKERKRTIVIMWEIAELVSYLAPL